MKFKDIKNKIRDFSGRHPFRAFFAACIVIPFVLTACIVFPMALVGEISPHQIPANMITGVLTFLFFTFPALISIVNLAGVFIGPEHTKDFHIFAWITLLAGTVLTVLYQWLNLAEIVWKDWPEQLYNSEVHAPIWSGGILPLAILAGLGIIAYFILSLHRADKLPPLLTVLCMGAMYLWGILCILWCVQLSTGEDFFPFYVLPVNCLFLILREIRVKILEWNAAEEGHAQKEWTEPWNRFLRKAGMWPVYAFIAMLPILGVLFCILALFGQSPDTLIRAFTETADWRLSKMTAPPNLYYDEHYLCTVAAGGHKQIVKPLRMGERHGHRVVVNRQLEIANAFEQVLKEKMPAAHRRIRRFYDTYGFPVAKCIRTKTACDLVYLLMKPLEWCFLAVLYLTDVHPEDRIAVQYLPKPGGTDQDSPD